MAHKVICLKCGREFDRDKEQAVKVNGRRYGHASCYPEIKELVPMPAKSAENPDLVKLKDYINEKYGKSANWALINKQIKTFTTENKYSLSGILKSLVYFYDIKHNSVEQSNGGIGIVPFCYQAAFDYYYALYLAQLQNEDKNIKEVTSRVREITIPLPQVPKKLHLFNFLDEENEE
jgi:hypothetical protein